MTDSDKHPPRQVSVRVLLRPHTPVPLDELIDRARHGRPISRRELWTSTSPSDDAIARVTAYFTRFGLHVSPKPIAWCTLEVRGDVAQFIFAFPRGPAEPIPEPLADVVEWVWGLNEFGLEEPEPADNPRGLDPIPTPPPTDPRAPRPEHHPPPAFVRYYGFPDAFDGSGQCVGVLALLGGYDHADLDELFGELGINKPTIIDHGENRRAWAAADLWMNLETSMDLQIASACAPGATFVVYHSGARHGGEVSSWTYFKLFSDALFDDVHRPSVLSLSMGLPENMPGCWTLGEARCVDAVLQLAACLNVTVCLPTGDSGSNFPTGNLMFDCPAMVYFPSTSPWCLSIGSTTVEAEHGQLVRERVWNRLAVHMNLYYRSNTPTPTPYHGGATTGGVSRYFELPAWQRKADVPVIQRIDMTNWVFTNASVFEGRGVPDVAACGDFMTGFRVRLDGRWCYGGGTCATAPLWAALIARINHALGRDVGFVTPIFYELVFERGARAFNQLDGYNGAFHTDPDRPWNPCVGLGSPRGVELIEALRAWFAELD